MPGSVIVIGSGLGGLLSGLLLARRGMEVTVLEQSRNIGGCLQSFRRKSHIFETGLHFVGGLGEGGRIRERFEEWGLMDLPWEALEGEEVVIGEDSFFLPSGYAACKEALASYFPADADAAAACLDDIAEVSNRSGEDFVHTLELPALQFLRSRIGNPLLLKVISGTSFKMELDADRLPLGIFARIFDVSMRSLHRLRGGGSLLAEALASQIRELGGRILTDRKVVALDISENRVHSVRTSDAMSYPADIVVSDVHPSVLVEMAGEGMRRSYRHRVAELKNTAGIFTANIALSADAPSLPKRSLYVHTSSADLWRPRTDVTESVCVSFGDRCVDLMTRCISGDRDHIASECIDLVSRRLPWLKSCVEDVYTSIPDTYFRYTGTPGGSAYGILKDCNDIMRTMLSSRTPVSNLFLAGQNVGIHGIAGVVESTCYTVSQIENQLGI